MRIDLVQQTASTVQVCKHLLDLCFPLTQVIFQPDPGSCGTEASGIGSVRGKSGQIKRFAFYASKAKHRFASVFDGDVWYREP